MRRKILIASVAFLWSMTATAVDAEDGMQLMEESHLAFYYAAEGGNARAQFYLGVLLESGVRGASDPARGLAARTAAACGDAWRVIPASPLTEHGAPERSR